MTRFEVEMGKVRKRIKRVVMEQNPEATHIDVTFGDSGVLGAGVNVVCWVGTQIKCSDYHLKGSVKQVVRNLKSRGLAENPLYTPL